MQHIPASSLSTLSSRQSYTLSFLNFTPADGAAINASAPIIAPLIPTILDAIYTKLLSYDITAKVFAPPLASHESHTDTKALHLEHAHIQRQKTFLKAYLLKIAKNEQWGSDAEIWTYFDKVAVMHTGVARRNKPELRVEVMHMALLLGYVEDLLVQTVVKLQLDDETKSNVLAAWNKVLWVQNDLFLRRYVVDRETGEKPVGLEVARDQRRELMILVLGAFVGYFILETVRKVLL